MDKFRHKLPREDLKKFAKDVNKKLVASDYKNNRVEDPTSITEKQEKKVKKFVKDFFDRAVEKYKAHEKKKAERASRARDVVQPGDNADSVTAPAVKDEDIIMTDDEAGSTPNSLDRKRKREDDAVGSPSVTPSETPSMKRLKEEEADVPSPPPPPPPPMDDDATLDMVTEHNKSHDGHDHALPHEDDEEQRMAVEAERQKLREEEAALERENELNMLDFEREQEQDKSGKMVNGTHHHINDRVPRAQEKSGGGLDPAEEESAAIQHSTRKHEVMSH